MQKISVQNFMALKRVDLEVSDLLILIGEQASGKSTISKLVYFFKSLRQDLIDVIYDDFEKESTLPPSFQSICMSNAEALVNLLYELYPARNPHCVDTQHDSSLLVYEGADFRSYLIPLPSGHITPLLGLLVENPKQQLIY